MALRKVAARLGTDTSVASLNVFVYLRVSTGRQAETDLSIPDQRRQIKAWAAAHGHTIVAEFVEPGASATDDRRPEFQRMIDRACDGSNEVGAIVVHSFSRFMRDSFMFEMYARRLGKHGVRLISITQDVSEDDPAQSMMRKVIALFDEYQSKENTKHVLRSMKENARQGFWNGARPPFGYRTIVVDQRGARIKKRLEIDIVEAETVRLVFRLALEGHNASGPMGVKSIADWLNRQGHRTRGGANWAIGPVHTMLTNTVYAGTGRFNRTESRTRARKSESEHVTAPSPIIIDRPVFERVQAQLKSRNPRISPPRVVSGPILLTGLAYCATCAGAMTLRTGTSKTGKVHRYYSCSTCARQGKSVCKGRSIPMDKLDGLVTNHLLDRLLAPERLTALIEALAVRRAEKSVAVEGRIAALHANAAEADERLRRLYKLVENGLAEMDDILKDRITALKAERETTRAALDRATGTNHPPIVIDPAKIAAFGAAMRERLTTGDVAYRKAHLGAVIDRIEVDDQQVRIMGRKDVLEAAVAAKGGPIPGVRSFVRKWRPVGDSNPCYQRERLVS
jgi:site-specific DNA recombinase